MQITIEINDNLEETLDTLSSNDEVTKEAYIERKVNAILISLMKDGVKKMIDEQKIEDVKSFKETLEPMVEAIKIRDYVEPIKIDIVPTEATSTEEVLK